MVGVGISYLSNCFHFGFVGHNEPFEFMHNVTKKKIFRLNKRNKQQEEDGRILFDVAAKERIEDGIAVHLADFEFTQLASEFLGLGESVREQFKIHQQQLLIRWI